MDYKIPFKGLENGNHQFKFNVDDKFFAQFDESDINQGKLVVNIDLIKRSTGLEVFVEISGIVVAQCDRCLDNLDCTIEYKGKIFFEFGSQNEEISDELIMLSQSEDNLELDNYIYEFINLSLPIQKFHPDDKDGYSLCNPDMLTKLDNITVNNDDKKIDDPRWDKLRDLIN